MKVIIAGSRLGVDTKFFEEKLKELFLEENSPYEITEIVSGGQRGVDNMGMLWGLLHNIPVKEFRANWNELGTAAGPCRNAEMAEYGDLLVAFFNADAMNKGTKNMCRQMVGKGKKIIRFHEKLCLPKKSLLIEPTLA